MMFDEEKRHKNANDSCLTFLDIFTKLKSVLDLISIGQMSVLYAEPVTLMKLNR